MKVIDRPSKPVCIEFEGHRAHGDGSLEKVIRYATCAPFLKSSTPSERENAQWGEECSIPYFAPGVVGTIFGLALPFCAFVAAQTSRALLRKRPSSNLTPKRASSEYSIENVAAI